MKRCRVTEERLEHESLEDAQSIVREMREAEAELMSDTFTLIAEQSLLESEDLLTDILAEHPHAVSRLALYSVRKDLLRPDYVISQLILDQARVGVTLKEWTKTAAEVVKEDWITEGTL